MPVSTAADSQTGTLARLRAASRTLFGKGGFHRTRPQDIAAEAGVASGTFYLHFKDKQAAFLDFAQQAQTELLECYAKNLEGVSGFDARIRVILETILDFSDAHPGVLHAAFMDPVFIAPDHEEAWRLYDRMGHFIYMAAGDEAVYADMKARYDVVLLSHALCGLLRHAMIYASRRHVPREVLVEELAGAIDRALRLPPETDVSTHRPPREP